jgi:hypothetical protein
MEQGLCSFPTNILEEQSCCDGNIEEENLLLDLLESDMICPREFDGYKSGPTLAELNDTRSRSPLINPEMKRLHQVAILTEEPVCESTSKTQSCSVLEQQLRTQQTASMYHEQHLPSHSNCSTAVATSVTRSECIPIPKPKRDMKLTQSVCLSPPSPQDRKPLFQDRKPFEHIYQTQNIKQQYSAPEFRGGYLAQGREIITTSSYPGEPLSNSQPSQQQESETSASHEQVANCAASSAYQSENCDESDEDDDEIDSEAEDVEEEYCPFQKEGKTPARRKGRKSESEDMVANPAKLLNIGRELDRLNKIISGLKPINEVPQHSRGRSRREKNKLASRYEM